METPVICVVGWHNAGKTTFVEKLVGELKRRGLRLATVKHSREDIEIDHPGTDTWRFARAGSDIVAISGKRQVVIIEHRDEEATLEEIVRHLPRDLDLIIAEGFKRAKAPKIEITRRGISDERIAAPDELLALVSDEEGLGRDSEAPRFDPDDAAGVADLLEARGLIRRPISPPVNAEGAKKHIDFV